MGAQPAGKEQVTVDRGAKGFPVGPATLMTALYALAYLAWERSGWGGDTVREVFGNLGFVPLNLVSAVLCLLASRHTILDPGVRRALRLLGCGYISVCIGNLISIAYILIRGESPAVSWADLFYMSDNGLMLAALLSFPLTRRIREEKWKFALDAAMMLTGSAVLIWYFTYFAVQPGEGTHQDPISTTILTAAYPLASLLLLLGIVTVLLREPIDRNRTAFGLLVASITISIVADLTFGLVQIDTGERSASWTDAVYLLMYLLAVASAELYLRHPVARSTATADRPSRLQRLSPLPYLLALAVYGLLLAAVLAPWSDPVSTVAIGALVMTGLVVVRQLLAVRQNVRLLAETAARQNEARFRALVQHSSDVIIVVTAEAEIRYVSPSAARVLRYEPERLLGLQLPALLQPEDRDLCRRFISEATIGRGVLAPVELAFRQPDGSRLQAEIIATNLLDEPTVRGIVLNTRDVSERKRLESELKHQAFHDPLTGLANRALFRDRVSHALTLAQRQKRSIMVLFLDLDDFKKVNDSLGHSEGDRLLVAAAERFESCSRAADTVARLGGDEFAILIEDVPGPDGHEKLVERLTAAMARPFMLSGNEVHIKASVGIATASGDETADDLLRNADVAMYTAKRRGKGRFATYESKMYSDIRERLEMEASLRGAIERSELVLHYQPIFHLRTGRITGVEALLRWDHPRYGHLLPQHFVPLAEETGLIVALGGWVLREACRQVQQWRRAYPELGLTVAVNISGRQLQEQDMVKETSAALRDTGVDPAAVVLEITESVLMQQTGSILEQLQQMKALGVGLAIDDFGTGYSSLSYLQRLPVQRLKIDRSFVANITSNPADAAIVRAVVSMAHSMGMRVVAEGVETEGQLGYLRGLSCEEMQGYYFSPPLAA
ncbi:MAG TPA: EAL domain-containing protein, partial [Gemmatimonadales bacterium]|nr:EAL domain-containing protein [Gemmatimonadales bacterium]